MRGLLFLVSHLNTNPAQQGLTSVKFSITRLSDSQRAHLWCKAVVRELENYQHVSPEANVSRFSFICYSSENGMLYFNTTQFSAFWFSVARTTGNPVYASRKHLVWDKFLIFSSTSVFPKIVRIIVMSLVLKLLIMLPLSINLKSRRALTLFGWKRTINTWRGAWHVVSLIEWCLQKSRHICGKTDNHIMAVFSRNFL